MEEKYEEIVELKWIDEFSDRSQCLISVYSISKKFYNIETRAKFLNSSNTLLWIDQYSLVNTAVSILILSFVASKITYFNSFASHLTLQFKKE